MIDTLKVVVDSVALIDSAQLHKNIVNGVTAVVSVVPDASPVIIGIKYAVVGLAGFLTAKGIGYFRKRKRNK